MLTIIDPSGGRIPHERAIKDGVALDQSGQRFCTCGWAGDAACAHIRAVKEALS
jgi:hypothetical protein